jgi:hypothetical protein
MRKEKEKEKGKEDEDEMYCKKDEIWKEQVYQIEVYM